jgi:hypothetical protein
MKDSIFSVSMWEASSLGLGWGRKALLIAMAKRSGFESPASRPFPVLLLNNAMRLNPRKDVRLLLNRWKKRPKRTSDFLLGAALPLPARVGLRRESRPRFRRPLKMQTAPEPEAVRDSGKSAPRQGHYYYRLDPATTQVT